MQRNAIMLGLLGLAAPVAANAGEVGFTSSGTTTFQVNVPPIAASLQASASGAAGLWTVQGANEGLMIGLNRQGEGYDAVTLYSRNSDGLTLSWGQSGQFTNPSASTGGGGLDQVTFSVPQGAAPVRTFVVGAI